jgi:hypothetical protein
MKRLMLAAILLGAMPGAWARDAGGSYATVEARPCAAFLQDQKARGFDYNADAAWVAGYLTAYNALTPDTGDILGGTDLSGALLWLQNYCQAHPSQGLAEGTAALTAELQPRRLRTLGGTAR